MNTLNTHMKNNMASAVHQKGLTMVELLVALTLSGLIALAAIAALTVARRGFTTVDSASQLRDNARFASDLVQRIAAQAGYQDLTRANQTRASEIKVYGSSVAASGPEPFVKGFNNMVFKPVTGLDAVVRNLTNGGCISGDDASACLNGSDVLILRYQTQELYRATGASSPLSDRAMINCKGEAEPLPPTGADDFTISVFHVKRSSGGEPALMCSTGTSTTFGTGNPQPVIQGVESFQVLYGMAYRKGIPTTRGGTSDTARYDLPERYLRADEITTDDQWRQVRSLRIALLLRSPKNANQDRASQRLQLLGGDNSKDAGSDIWFTDGTPPVNTANFIFPQDGRQRQVVTFTVYLRNDQDPLKQE